MIEIAFDSSPNENKMSYRYQQRALLEVEMIWSSEM